MTTIEKKIAKLYDEATKEAAKIGVSVPHFDPNKPFDAKNYPSSSKKLDKIVGELMQMIQVVIENGIEEQWEIANSKNDKMCHLAFGPQAAAMTGEQLSKYFNNHDQARDSFKSRKVSGLGLSDRVWNLTEQFKEQVEMAIDLGLRDGVSAARMSTTLKQYLNDPDKLFRRVRDEHGVLRLSKAAKSYHPGQGRYRSSHKNAMRLARTETNMAYRTADHLRIQDFDFVVGIEVHRSDHPYPCPVCEALAGKYPKDFKFVGWHPQCRCYTTTILKDDEEFWNDLDNDTNTPSKNEVKEPPKGFNDWVKDNKDRIERAEKKDNLAYFLRDNKGYVDGVLGRKVSYDDVKEKLARTQKPLSKNTYVAFEPFSPVIIENVRKLKDRRQKNILFNEILNDERTSILHEIEDVKTTIYPNHKGKKSKRWEETKEMARDLNKHGSNVCFLPEYEEVSSADAIVQFGKRWSIADFKYSVSTKHNTIAEDLIKGFTQADCIVLKAVNIDAGTFRGVIEQIRRNGNVSGDIVLINKYGKSKELERKDIISGKYLKLIKGFL